MAARRCSRVSAPLQITDIDDDIFITSVAQSHICAQFSVSGVALVRSCIDILYFKFEYSHEIRTRC